MPNSDKEPHSRAAKSKRQETRKRSPKACLSCRARKVRCDVAFVSNTCTNCVLDQKECVVERRRRRHHRYSFTGTALSCHSAAEERVADFPVGTRNADEEDSAVALTEDDDASPKLPSTEPGYVLSHATFQAQQDVSFSNYPFVCISCLEDMRPDDLNYLESQGCLRVPESTYLEELLRAYFLHAHPVLPVMNEAECWAAFDATSATGDMPTSRIPLLLLSAMLFVACNYIQDHITQSMGFTTAQEARNTLYRRTKLLYDHETESSPLLLAQACLLLAHWSSQSPSSSSRSTVWLNRAIHHLQSTSPPRNRSHSLLAWPQLSLEERANLTRVWNCCILSDCIHSLYNRRSLMIPGNCMDGDNCDAAINVRGYLSYEIGRSRVYGVESKQRWIEAQVQAATLCRILTRVLGLTYPQHHTGTYGKRVEPRGQGQGIRDCKRDLGTWRVQTLSVFPSSGTRLMSSPCESESNSNNPRVEPQEQLLRTLYIHYHSGMLALHHLEMKRYLAASPISVAPSGQPFRNLQIHIYRCVIDIFDQTLDCLQHSHPPQLPDSMIHCILLPLFLQSLGTAARTAEGLSMPQKHGLSSGCTTVQASPSIQPGWVKRIMGSLRQDFSKDLCHMVRTIKGVENYVSQVLQTTQHGWAFTLDSSFHDTSALDEEALDFGRLKWSDLLMKMPQSYAHLIGTLDDVIACDRPIAESQREPLSECHDLFMSDSPLKDSSSGEEPQPSSVPDSIDPLQDHNMQQMLRLGTPEEDFFLRFEGGMVDESSPKTTSFMCPKDLHTGSQDTGEQHWGSAHRTQSIGEVPSFGAAEPNPSIPQATQELPSGSPPAETHCSGLDIKPPSACVTQEEKAGLEAAGERDWLKDLVVDDMSVEFEALKSSLMTNTALGSTEACTTV